MIKSGGRTRQENRERNKKRSRCTPAQTPRRNHKQSNNTRVTSNDPVEASHLQLTIITWNIDGFSGDAKRLEVLSRFWRLEADVAVLTETHLLDEDIFYDPPGVGERFFKIRMDHYGISDWRNREPGGQRGGGEC